MLTEPGGDPLRRLGWTGAASRTLTARLSDLGGAVFLMFGVWLALMGGQRLVSGFGSEQGVLAAFFVATVVVLVSRRRCGEVFDPIAIPFGVVIGFVSFVAWLHLIWIVGGVLELSDSRGAQAPAQELSIAFVGTIVLAPCFEELLYRERLLLALRPFAGSTLAVAISAGCFALPHLHDWSILGTFCVGLFLGAVMLKTRSVALCIGIHAGLNLAATLCGVPAQRWDLHWALSAGLSLLLLFVAAGVLRRRSMAGGRIVGSRA